MVSNRKNYFVFGILALTACVLFAIFYITKPTAEHITLSYYHWKNSYRNLPDLKQSHPAHRLYIKFLDLGYNSQKLEVNPTRFIDPPPTAPKTIPVVYLDNRALAKSTIENVRQLILQYIPPRQYQNIQIDCDWSPSTRKKYFTLLEQLQAHYPTLSATLRLHQVKYAQKTGVPPVTYGVLMYYNMSEIRDINTRNYVLDHSVGKQYLQNFAQYPLRMELALPLYQQVRVIRQQRVTLLLPYDDMQLDKLQQIETLGEGKFEVTAAHYWQGEYLYAGDQLIVDQVSIEQLREASRDLTRHIQPQEIIFYSYQDARRYPHEALQDLSVLFE